MAGLDHILDQSDGLFRSLLRRNEGSRLTRYSDSLGVPTIGVGFNLNRKDAQSRIEAFGLNFDAVLTGSQNLTQQQSDQLAGETEAEAIDISRTLVPNYNKLNRARQMAIADMAHTLGKKRLSKFTAMLDALNQDKPNFRSVSAEVRNSLYFQQLPDRARRNAEVLLSGQLAGFDIAPSAKQIHALVSDTDPDKAAELRRLSKDTGVPLRLVEANPKEIERAKTRRGLDRVLFPVTARKMQEPEFAKIAHDDDSLQKVESAATGLDAAINAFHRGELRLVQIANQALGERAQQALID